MFCLFIVSKPLLAHFWQSRKSDKQVSAYMQQHTASPVRYNIDIQNNTKHNNTMNIKPLADRVLIKPAPAEEKTVGGIIIPDTAKEKPLQGEVLAVGGGTKDEEMVLKAGDRVLYGKYSGTEVELDGEKYLIMRQSDVLAII